MKKSIVALILALTTLFAMATPAFADESLMWGNIYKEEHTYKGYIPSEDGRSVEEVVESIQSYGIKVPSIPEGRYTYESLVEFDLTLELLSKSVLDEMNAWLKSKGSSPVSICWKVNSSLKPQSKPTAEQPAIALYYTLPETDGALPMHSTTGASMRAFGYIYYDMLKDRLGADAISDKVVEFGKDYHWSDGSVGVPTTLSRQEIANCFAGVFLCSHREKLGEHSIEQSFQNQVNSFVRHGFYGYKLASWLYPQISYDLSKSSGYIESCAAKSLKYLDEGRKAVTGR